MQNATKGGYSRGRRDSAAVRSRERDDLDDILRRLDTDLDARRSVG
jgi:hypothetical protein